MLNEIAIVSGKGGTGKTTVALCIIPYFEELVIADCDVDAPDLNILLDQGLTAREDFIGFQRPVINEVDCTKCGICYDNCKFDAITPDIKIKKGMCEGCGVCDYLCPSGAISMVDYKIGELFTRNTNFGPMIDARLIPGEEASGKLVAMVRKASIAVAEKEHAKTIIIDGSPGIACNVISTISGVSKALIVTEPTDSGLHDLKRVLRLSEMFSVKSNVVINKYDLNKEKTQEIIDFCDLNDTKVILKIPFEPKIVESISNLVIPSTTNIPFFKSEEWLKFISYVTQDDARF